MNAAIKDCKIAPARLAHWQAQYDADAEGITKIVNELPSVIPVTEIGHGGSGDEGTRTPQRTRRTSLPRPRRPASGLSRGDRKAERMHSLLRRRHRHNGLGCAATGKRFVRVSANRQAGRRIKSVEFVEVTSTFSNKSA